MEAAAQQIYTGRAETLARGNERSNDLAHSRHTPVVPQCEAVEKIELNGTVAAKNVHLETGGARIHADQHGESCPSVLAAYEQLTLARADHEPTFGQPRRLGP